MLGTILMGVSAAMGIMDGYSTYSQGKKLIKSGEKIKAMYSGMKKEGKGWEDTEKKTKANAKAIKDIQHQQANIQFEYNQNEIKRALEKNLKGIVNQYIVANDETNKEIMDIKAKLNFSNDIKGVESHSLKNDSMTRLQAESDYNAKMLIENERNSLEEVANKSNAEEYNNKNMYASTKEGINQNYLVAFSNAELQLTRDLAQLHGFIQNGTTQANQLIAQGGNAQVQGINRAIESIMGLGLNLAKKGVFNFGNSNNSNSGFLKEVQGTYNSGGYLRELPRIYQPPTLVGVD